MWRQGDVLITTIQKIPKGTKKVLNGVILYGESSGHAHRLVGGDVLTKGDAMFLKVTKKGTIVHDEHKSITLKKGLYGVTRQREYLTKDMTKVVVD